MKFLKVDFQSHHVYIFSTERGIRICLYHTKLLPMKTIFLVEYARPHKTSALFLIQEVQQLGTAVCSTSYFILHTSPGCQGSKEQTSLRITQTTNTRYIVTVQRKETWDVLQFSRSTVALTVTAKERKKLSRRGRFHTQKLTFPLILIKDLICYPSQIPSLSHRYF